MLLVDAEGVEGMGRSNQQRRRAKSRARARTHRAHAPARVSGSHRHPDGGWEHEGWGDVTGEEAGGLSLLDILLTTSQRRAGAFASPGAPEALTEQHMAAWVDALLWHAGTGPARLAGNRLAEALETPLGRRLATRDILARLQETVDETWHRGWRPGEVHRVILRTASAAAARIVSDAMALDLGRYAPSTVVPAWLDELAGLGASVWWPRESDPLSARAGSASGPDPMGRVLDDAMDAVRALRALPPLELLDPLPGEWRELGPESRDPHAHPLDAKLLERVRRLLAKAESTPYEAEAETFTAAAQKLMARHSIDLAMLAATGRRDDDDRPRSIRIGIDRPYEQPKVMLLDAVARANRCRTVWSSGVSLVTVIGFVADLEAVETLFTSLHLQATTAVAAAGTRQTAWGSRTRSFRSSFLTSFAVRIGERLAMETDTVLSEAVTEAARQPGPGTDLVLVLKERSEEVDAAVTERFPNLVSKSVSRVNDAEGWAAGRRAADSAALRTREELPT